MFSLLKKKENGLVVVIVITAAYSWCHLVKRLSRQYLVYSKDAADIFSSRYK